LGRAFFRDALLLVLDEPTSAIDAKAEYEIFQRLYDFSQGKSLIIISHRFSTVRNADKIYVIDEGQIIECGSHDDLIRLGGKYKDAFDTQARGYQ
jgi:ATP-binding cassette, subfamily B, bacterial